MKGILITYWFSPKESIATQRTKSFYRYLNSSGMKLDVICPNWGETEKIPGTEIWQTHPIDSTVFKFERSLKTKIKEFILYKIFKYNYFRDSKKGKFYQEAVHAIDKIDLSSYDFILTSYNPFDVIHIGNYIKQKYPHIKWVIDYRDYYSLNHYMDFGIFRPYFKKLEKNICKPSDAFVTVSETLKNGIEKFLEKKGKVIYNGYEIPSDIPLSEKLSKQLNGLPIISYCGSLYNGKRDIEHFFQFYKTGRLDMKFQFVFALIDEKDLHLVQQTIDRLQIKNVQVFTSLSHQEALSLQQHSRFLALFSDFHRKSNGFLSGKIFEYMPYKKPIIYSGNTKNFELYDLIKKAAIGECYTRFDFDQPSEINGEIAIYLRKNQAEQLQKFITDIVHEH